MTASLHEDYIEQFLSVPKMSVQHLSELTRLSGISTQIHALIKELSEKKNVDTKLTEKEQTAFTELYRLMETFM